MESFSQCAQDYLAKGRSVIPLYPRGKLPYFQLLPLGVSGKHTWKPYRDTHPTMDDIDLWDRASRGKANIGQITGEVSGVFGLDVDFRNGGDKTWRELNGGQAICTETTLAGDGFHLILKYPGYRFKLKEKLPGIDLRSDGGYLVAPYSIHPSGRTYTVQYPSQVLDPPDFLKELMIPAGEPRTPCYSLKSACEGLRHFGLNTWEEFDVEYVHVLEALRVFRTCEVGRLRYASRSEFDFAVTVKLCNKGFDLPVIYAAFHAARNHATHYAAKVQDQGPEAAFDYLNAVWTKVVEQPSYARDNAAVSCQADEFRRMVNSRIWKGVGGKSDQALLLAHIHFCVIGNRQDEEGRQTWDACVRDLAEKACLSIGTVSRANARLTKDGWLEPTSNIWANRQDARSYRFGKMWTDWNTRTHLKEGKSMSTYVPLGIRPQTHGVFENRTGLGKTAETIWWALIDGCRTLSELQQKTGCSLKTLKRHLTKMLNHGMLSIQDGRFEPMSDFDFKELAQNLETDCIAVRRVEKHDKHREAQAKNLMFWKQLKKGEVGNL
jgi:DNA-binding HxlR family transcriptional regulator